MQLLECCHLEKYSCQSFAFFGAQAFFGEPERCAQIQLSQGHHRWVGSAAQQL
jgi:hypothetical protein